MTQMSDLGSVRRFVAILAGLFLASSVGCEHNNRLGDGSGPVDLSGVPPTDMAGGSFNCAAAQGITGSEALICIDFDKLSLGVVNPSALPAELTGWNFDVGCSYGSGMSEKWEIAEPTGGGGRALQLQFFDGLGTSGRGKECAFAPPAQSGATFSSFTSFTLAVVQWLDLATATPDAEQRATTFLAPPPTAPTAVQFIGSQKLWLHWKVQMTTTELMSLGLSQYQPYFHVQSKKGGGGSPLGWRIKSIAVIGHK